MIAASKGRKDMFDLLLENRADLSLVGNIGNNILHTVCEGGNMELVKHILAQNIVEINSQTDNGWTPAMKAASEGHKEVLKLLVSKGADLSLVNNVDNNILHVAFENRHAEIVKYILTYDLVDVNSRSGEGMTPVMFAALEGSVEMFDFINAVNINGKNVDGKTPVLMAAVRGYKDKFDLLVSEGADLPIVDAKGETILHRVSVVGNVDIVKHALSQKNIVQDINRKGEQDRTPVMVAAISGHKEVFDLLVKKGADLTLVDRDGNSILHLAARGVNVDIAKYLLSHNNVDINGKGAEIHGHNETGQQEGEHNWTNGDANPCPNALSPNLTGDEANRHSRRR
ncbi:putative ankyrin repeat protein RF_0381 [Haliotis cracherodii]|uniref:putative ankyrin repeat protein RF_0381 n=1 Tax=Haliotis cracherodii TaxID=6455 RepID=UPI0039EC4CFB